MFRRTLCNLQWNSVKSSALEQSVGNTPLIYLKSASRLAGCNIYGKAEYTNPGGSVKDRAALWMIRRAENSGRLTPGKPGLIVEGTAGNTGIGLAMVALTKGYRTIICLPRTQSQEKKDILRWAGAQLVELDAVPFRNPRNYVHVAARLAKMLQDQGLPCVYANQWDNLANRLAHIEGTGPEIWRQTEGDVTAFCCAMGTGGTLSGVATFLKGVNPNIQIALTDPCGSALSRFFDTGILEVCGSSISEGIGQGRVTGNMQGFKPDRTFEITDNDMQDALNMVQSEDGICVGLSSGINIAGAIQFGRTLNDPEANVVTMLCDAGFRYSKKQFNTEFLRSKGLNPPFWLEQDNSDLNLEALVEVAKEPPVSEQHSGIEV